MTITPIPIGVVYTIIEMINQHDCKEEVTIDGNLIPRSSKYPPYAMGRPFQTLRIQVYGRGYCIENGLAYLREGSDYEGDIHESYK